MIKPTNGRVVLFTPGPSFLGAWLDKAQPLAATVAHVHDDRVVNLAVSDSFGRPHYETGVPLLQDDDTPPTFGRYCEWMPYQKGQAAKTEQLQEQLKTS